MSKEKFFKKDQFESLHELIQEIQNKEYPMDINLVKKAFNISYLGYCKKLAVPNKTHILHSLEIAKIVTGLGMDTSSIITALLYHGLANDFFTYKDIINNFGPMIANLIQNVAELSHVKNKVSFLNQKQEKAETYKGLLVKIPDDIRVLIIKLADKLHNMRLLKHIRNSSKRRNIALEAIEIYAPLAEKIGIRFLKEELQDLAFTELYPKERIRIESQIRKLKESNKGLIREVERNLKDALSKSKLGFIEISSREKKPFSVWKKMQGQGLALLEVYDIFALRVITRNKDDCYRALSVIHGKYCHVPDKLKDFISIPKINGYQSLHTVIVASSQQVEIQIRDENMHRIAEFGSAAHWKYKNHTVEEEIKYYDIWIDEILTVAQDPCTSDETINNTKLAVSYHQIFCFTPKGKQIPLAKGATVLDFAFYVSTDIGLKCKGATINGKNVPVSHKLKNGDIVRIVCEEQYIASETWFNILLTGKARAELRKYLSVQNKRKSD